MAVLKEKCSNLLSTLVCFATATKIDDMTKRVSSEMKISICTRSNKVSNKIGSIKFSSSPIIVEVAASRVNPI